MSQSVYIGILKAVTATQASVRCITAFSTSRRSDDRLIVVTERVNFGGFQFNTADGANFVFTAFVGASGFYGCGPIACGVTQSDDHGRFEGDLGFSVYVGVIQTANGATIIRRIARVKTGCGFCRHVFQSCIIMVVYRRLDIGRHDPDSARRHRKGIYLTFCHRDHVVQRNDQLARTPAGRRYKDHSVAIPRLDLDDDPVLYDDGPRVFPVSKENAGNSRIIITGIKVDSDRISQRANDIIAFH